MTCSLEKALQNIEKHIELCESTAGEVSFEWLHHGFHPQTQKLELHTK